MTHKVEHFITLFDKNFLPSGICLYRSLERTHKNFVLWILCMDDEVWSQLLSYNFGNIRLIRLSEIETNELLEVKKQRTAVEYCWTLTPFAPNIVFDRDSSADRVTYIDADLYFFDSTNKIFDEFQASGSDVMITEHGYAKRYDKSEKSGIYCVQFMTFRKTLDAKRVLNWWQNKCIEWCFNRCEDGKCGDQKYLDDWPIRFGKAVHVLANPSLSLAPWNLIRFVDEFNEGRMPTFFHFHGLRIISTKSIRLFFGYHIPKNGMRYYQQYVDMLISIVLEINSRFGSFPVLPEESGIKFCIKKKVFQIFGMVKYKSFNCS